MSNKEFVSLKMELILMDDVKSIASIKWPVRNITTYAEAAREALIEFVEKNKEPKTETPKIKV